MASYQVSNVIKRVHEAAAVDFNDNSKRCRYDNDRNGFDGMKSDVTENEKYGSLEDSNMKQCHLNNQGDCEMDVDYILGHFKSQQGFEKDEMRQLQYQQHSNPNPQQDQQQQQQNDSQSQLMAQIFQDQKKNDFCTMGQDNFGSNIYLPFTSKFDAFNTKKSAEYSQTIDDVEYMYQTTHGGDFMRHLNNYPGEDL